MTDLQTDSEGANMTTDIHTRSITGVKPHDPKRRPLGYAVCRQWRDNPCDVEVYEYADTEADARAMIRKLARNDSRYVWFVGVYQ